MDTDLDDGDHPMGEDDHYLRVQQPMPVRVPSNSDPASDEEDHEPKTPSPEPVPMPAPRSFTSVAYIPQPIERSRELPFHVDPDTYAKLKQLPGRVSGVEVEDALLLLGFHHHIVH